MLRTFKKENRFREKIWRSDVIILVRGIDSSGRPPLNCMLYIYSFPLFSQTSHIFMRSSLYGFSCASWKRGIWHAGTKLISLELNQFMLPRFPVRCYSTLRKSATRRLSKADSRPSMMDESNSFYVVRKGDVVGIFKNLSDCQAQVGLVFDPPVSVYKGYSLSKEADQHLVSHGLKNATYVISAAHVKDDLFGTLVPCPYQQPDGLLPSLTETTKTAPAQERLHDLVQLDNNNLCGILAFDGASKGNPGKAGAGAVLQTEDGRTVWQVREGLGVVSNNVAEYRAMILGLKFALKKGFKRICVKGDSKLVCMQIQGLWKAKNQNMVNLCKEAKELRDRFQSFKISHIERKFNSEADAQANLAVTLENGEVREVCEDKNLLQI